MIPMKKSTTRITIVIVIGIILIVGYYAYLSSQSKDRLQETELSKVQTVLSKDLARDYPPTPKEVIKYYNEILRCFYNEECTEEEIDDLGSKARELYDEELLANNEMGMYLLRLHAEIADYKENSRRISSVAVASSTNVDLFEQDGYSFARILCKYNISENGVNRPSDQVYLLRRDEDKKWKIYGWQPADEVEVKE